MSRQSSRSFFWFGAGFLTAGVAALVLVAVGVVGGNSSGGSSEQSGALTSSGGCPARIVSPSADSYCVLRAGDNSSASVTVQLDAASEAGKTRYVITCDYTKVNSTVTYRRAANSGWETLTDNRTNNPQCGSGNTLIWKYSPENYQPYQYQPEVKRARNLEVTFTIPSTNAAYGWLAPFYNAPSIHVAVVDLCGPNGDQPCP